MIGRQSCPSGQHNQTELYGSVKCTLTIRSINWQRCPPGQPNQTSPYGLVKHTPTIRSAGKLKVSTHTSQSNRTIQFNQTRPDYTVGQQRCPLKQSNQTKQYGSIKRTPTAWSADKGIHKDSRIRRNYTVWSNALQPAVRSSVQQKEVSYFSFA